MSWKKLILVIIFYQDYAVSKEQGSFKLQMKDGNFFFDDGSGELPIDVADKGPDILSLEDGDVQSVAAGSNTDKTLNLLDKTIIGRGNGQENKETRPKAEGITHGKNMNELQRIWTDCNLAETAAHGEQAGLRLGSKEKPLGNQSNATHKTAKEIARNSKMTDADMQKIREVLDREYGNSVLLIPKNDLEYFIHFVKEYSLNDPLRSSDSAEFQNAEDRMRLRDQLAPTGIPRYQLDWSKALPPKTQPFEQLTPENRQLIVEEFSKFLELLNTPKYVSRIQNFNNSARKCSEEPNIQMPLVKSNVQTNSVNQQELASFEAVRDILDNLSDDRSKQSLMRLFDKNSVAEPSEKHSNRRRSLGIFSLKSSPMKKKKDKQRGNSHNATDKASQYQRISRADKPRRHNPVHLFPHLLRSEENLMSGEQHTRADIIR